MSGKSVLMTAYIFPPLGGGGVLRTLKFAAYLPDCGWSPTVLTCRDGVGLPTDKSLLRMIPEGVAVERVADPAGWFKRRPSAGTVGTGRGSRLKRALVRTAGYLPGEHPFWRPRAAARGSDLAKKESFDIVYSTSSPSDNHLIARRIARRAGIPWVADFRDPWTWNYLYYKPWPTRAIERRLEKRIIEEADAVVTVSEAISEAYRRLLPRSERDRVVTIPNGYDPRDFEGLEAGSEPDDKIKLVYCGNFDRRHRPTRFLTALSRFLAGRPDLRNRLRVRFIGNFIPEDRDLIGESGLEDMVSVEGYRPYRECLAALSGADILLFLVYSGPGAEINISGKIYQYLALRKPILGIAPEGEAEKLLVSSGLARTADPDDIDSIAAALAGSVDDFDGGGVREANEELIGSFAYPALTRRLAEVFDRVGRSRP